MVRKPLRDSQIYSVHVIPKHMEFQPLPLTEYGEIEDGHSVYPLNQFRITLDFETNPVCSGFNLKEFLKLEFSVHQQRPFHIPHQPYNSD